MSDKKMWNISHFYSQAWQLAKAQPKLWILGLAVSLYAGGGSSNFNLPNFSQDTSSPETEYSTEIEERYQQLETGIEDYSFEEITPAETEEMAPQLQEMMQGFKNLSGWFYILGGLQLLILVAALIALSLALMGWSTSALIAGVSDAAANKEIKLKNVSELAVTKIKSVIWLSFIPGLKLMLKALLIGVVLAMAGGFLGVMTDSPVIAGIVGLLFLGGFCYFVYKMIRLGLAITWAMRALVLEDVSGSEALTRGFELAQGNYWKTLKLGASTVLVAIVVMMVLFIPLAGVGGYAAWQTASGVFNPVVIGSAAVVGLISVVAMTLVQAVLNVVIYGVWHYGYLTIKEHHGQ